MQAKKVKASKGKKLHLFRDGFTLPSATEPTDDAESTLLLDMQSESSNKVQLPTAAIKNKVIRTLLLIINPRITYTLRSVLAVVNGQLDNIWL